MTGSDRPVGQLASSERKNRWILPGLSYLAVLFLVFLVLNIAFRREVTFDPARALEEVAKAVLAAFIALLVVYVNEKRELERRRGSALQVLHAVAANLGAPLDDALLVLGRLVACFRERTIAGADAWADRDAFNAQLRTVEKGVSDASTLILTQLTTIEEVVPGALRVFVTCSERCRLHLNASSQESARSAIEGMRELRSWLDYVRHN